MYVYNMQYTYVVCMCMVRLGQVITIIHTYIHTYIYIHSFIVLKCTTVRTLCRQTASVNRVIICLASTCRQTGDLLMYVCKYVCMYCMYVCMYCIVRKCMFYEVLRIYYVCLYTYFILDFQCMYVCMYVCMYDRRQSLRSRKANIREIFFRDVSSALHEIEEFVLESLPDLSRKYASTYIHTCICIYTYTYN